MLPPLVLLLVPRRGCCHPIAQACLPAWQPARLPLPVYLRLAVLFVVAVVMISIFYICKRHHLASGANPLGANRFNRQAPRHLHASGAMLALDFPHHIAAACLLVPNQPSQLCCAAPARPAAGLMTAKTSMTPTTAGASHRCRSRRVACR